MTAIAKRPAPAFDTQSLLHEIITWVNFQVATGKRPKGRPDLAAAA